MTQHNQFPLRGAAAWPGTNTLSGKLDDGSGQLTLNSKNVMINTADTLAKRKGFVRGLDERFSGPVCGLHRYTSECGIEYLLVSDETGIFIRTPFAVPVFTVSDAYPNDSFPGDTNTPNLTWWRDPSIGYHHVNDLLRIKSGQPNPLVWFKEATSSSYQMTVDFVIDPASSADGVVTFMKSSSDTGVGGSLNLQIQASSDVLACALNFRNMTDVVLSSDTIIRGATGRAILTYNAATRKATAVIFTTGQPLELSATLTAVQDAELGQKSMLQVTGTGTTGFDTVFGAPV